MNFSRVLRFISQGANERSGNVAVLFALILTVVVVGAGVAVDFARMTQIRVSASEAADAGLLAAARVYATDKTVTQAEAKDIANDFFKSQSQKFKDATFSAFDFKANRNTGIYELTIKASMDTSVMRVLGVNEIDFDVLSVAELGPPRELEAVLVLDATDSMFGDRIASLKSSAKTLVQTLMDPKTPNVKIGVVPFGNYVNIGMSRRYEPWINVPADGVTQVESCSDTYPNQKKTGRKLKRTKTESYNCRKVPHTCTTDGRSYGCQRDQCDKRQVEEEYDEIDRGDPVRVCKMVDRHTRWHGCVGSRNHPLDIEDRDFVGATRAIGVMNITCPTEIQPLTDNQGQVISKISSLSLLGETYIPAGLTWGLRMLSNASPFTEGVTYADARAKGSIKALVLMTDGANTRSPNYPKHSNTDRAKADELTRDLCKEVKANGVRLYTISFEVTDKAIKDLMLECASSSDEFFDARDGAALADAFDQIATSLTQLALTK